MLEDYFNKTHLMSLSKIVIGQYGIGVQIK